MDVVRLREQIPVCRNMTYMNTGWSGPSPRSVVRAIKDRLDLEMEQGPTTPDVYQSGRQIQADAREAVAGLLNASIEEISLTENTTQGLNMVINGLPWSACDEIVTFNLEHSSVLVPSRYQEHRHGAVVKVVDLASDESWDAILAKVEEAFTPRTRLVFLSHIEYSTGLRMPVKELRDLTRDRGALLLLDGAQTPGHIDLDMKDLDCDFYSIPAQKWLLGPDGAGALYIRKDLIPSVAPVHVSSRAAHASGNPHQFEPNTDTIDKLQLSSSSYALRAGMLEAIRFVQDIGLKEIEERDLDLATAFKSALQEIPGVTVLTPMERGRSCGLVSFNVAGIEPKAAVERLWVDHHIVCRPVSFPSCIRVSLHFFNTEEEVEGLVSAVRGLAQH